MPVAENPVTLPDEAVAVQLKVVPATVAVGVNAALAPEQIV